MAIFAGRCASGFERRTDHPAPLQATPAKCRKIKALHAALHLTSLCNTDTLRAMKRLIPVIALSCAAAVHAQPSEGAYEDMDALLAEKGVMARLGEQIQQARESVSEKASGLVINAMGFLGVPYKYGGNSAETGFDCSGFVRAVFEQSVGKVLPRRADEQAAATQAIDRNELKPGDLVFFNTMKRAFSHVGIYMGDGKFIHAPRTGSQVRVEDMRLAYWQTRFNGARRVPLASADASAASPLR
jgi:hypothetical protein